jgi:hypothetical protein
MIEEIITKTSKASNIQKVNNTRIKLNIYQINKNDYCITGNRSSALFVFSVHEIIMSLL